MALFNTLVFGLLYAAAGLAAPIDDNEASSRPSARTDSGVIVGTTTVEEASRKPVVRFLGIPFGAKPERFSPPRSHEPWASPYDASSFKPACYQKFDYPEEARRRSMDWFNKPPPPVEDGEDCLNLNIFAPLPSSPRTGNCKKAALPVLFWLYGGGFGFGAGSLPAYDGTSFAANQDIIVVTSNYRTNVFGFPGSPDIKRSAQNLGLLDQRLALDWVRRNIAAFGGDPDKITIAGESAGAGSVDTLVTAPPTPRAFRAAIMQSGQASVIGSNNNSAVSWEKLAKAANCPPGQSLSCLRDMPAPKLRDMVEREALTFGPIHDDGVTWANHGRQDRWESTKRSSRIARVPVMIGSNSDEGLTFVYGINNTAKYFAEHFPDYKDELTDVANKHYPVGSPGIPDEYRQLSAMMTELAFQCPARVFTADDLKAWIPTWRYYFDAGFANTEIFPDSGAWHSSEIPLVFGTYPRNGATSYQMALSHKMQTAWANFVKDPEAGPGWERSPRLAHIGAGVRPEKDFLPAADEMIKNISGWHLDRRCYLFQKVYDDLTLQKRI